MGTDPVFPEKGSVPDAGWWLYVLECKGGVLYTGIARDVEARFAAHGKRGGAKFTRRNRPLRILSRARLATKGEALRAEIALKKLRRAEKLAWCIRGLDAFVATVIGDVPQLAN